MESEDAAGGPVTLSSCSKVMVPLATKTRHSGMTSYEPLRESPFQQAVQSDSHAGAALRGLDV